MRVVVGEGGRSTGVLLYKHTHITLCVGPIQIMLYQHN